MSETSESRAEVYDRRVAVRQELNKARVAEIAESSDRAAASALLQSWAIWGIAVVFNTVAFVGGLLVIADPANLVTAVSVVVGGFLLKAVVLKVEGVIARNISRVLSEIFTASVMIAIAFFAGSIYIWLSLAAAYGGWLIGRSMQASAGLKNY